MSEDRMKLLRNMVECLNCRDVIESTHRHDYVSCSCGEVATDGGKDYMRRSGDPKFMNDLSVWQQYEDIDEEIYNSYIACLDNNDDIELALAETAYLYDEEEDFIQSIVDKFEEHL